MNVIAFAHDRDEEIANDNVEVEDNVITVENSDSYYKLKSIIPVSLKQMEDDKQWGLQFLAENENGDLITFLSIFVLDGDEEQSYYENEYMKHFPISEEAAFISVTLGYKLIQDKITNYITDFIFDYDNNKLDSEVKEFKFKAYNSVTKKVFDFYVNTELYSCIKYFMDHIKSLSFNIHSLSVSAISGIFKEEFKNPEILIVRSINNIVHIAKFDKKSSVAIVEFECTASRIDKNGNTDLNDYNILTSFDIGTKITRKMTKGCTMEKINNSFLIEKDQYISTTSFISDFYQDGNIDKLDKSYFTIRGINKDDDVKLFFINNACQEKILELIYDR